MNAKFFTLTALLIAFAGITSTASAEDHGHKVDSKNLFQGKYVVVDNGPILESELPSTAPRNIVEEEIDAPQYVWNKSTRTWMKNPNYGSHAKVKAQSRKA
jgi:hypothetical protein